jgi:hypothetical protein
LKLLLPPGRLAVCRILDFHPPHVVGIRFIFPLGDDPFEVTLTRRAEQSHTSVDDEIGVQHKRRVARDDLSERRLAFQERLVAIVTSVEPDDIKRDEARWVTAVQEPVKARHTSFIEEHNLTVDDRVLDLQRAGNPYTQVIEPSVGVASARDELGGSALNFN